MVAVRLSVHARSLGQPRGNGCRNRRTDRELCSAARRDRDAGFDGVDLFAGYNCLVDQFWSPLTNKRETNGAAAWKTGCASRLEICERIRKMAGDDFIIGMTVSGAEPYPGGLAIEDKQEILVLSR